MNEHVFPSAGRPAPQAFTFGAPAVDARLKAGLTRGALHEVYARDEDATAASGFALLLALRASAENPLLIIREDRCVGELGRVYGKGLADLGGDPAALIIVHVCDAPSALRAAGDAVACTAIGSVIVEPWRAPPVFDLTASRRLALRAERSGVFTLIVRVGVEPIASAAATRWQIAAAPSAALAANAPGHPAFDISLLRHRGGIAGFDARVEWDSEQKSFRDTPNSGALSALSSRRTGAPRSRRAA